MTLEKFRIHYGYGTENYVSNIERSFLNKINEEEDIDEEIQRLERLELEQETLAVLEDNEFIDEFYLD